MEKPQVLEMLNKAELQRIVAVEKIKKTILDSVDISKAVDLVKNTQEVFTARIVLDIDGNGSNIRAIVFPRRESIYLEYIKQYDIQVKPGTYQVI